MDIYIVLALLCVASASSIFLGHAAGYSKGENVGFRKGYKTALNNSYGKHNGYVEDK